MEVADRTWRARVQRVQRQSLQSSTRWNEVRKAQMYSRSLSVLLPFVLQHFPRVLFPSAPGAMRPLSRRVRAQILLLHETTLSPPPLLFLLQPSSTPLSNLYVKHTPSTTPPTSIIADNIHRNPTVSDRSAHEKAPGSSRTFSTIISPSPLGHSPSLLPHRAPPGHLVPPTSDSMEQLNLSLHVPFRTDHVSLSSSLKCPTRSRPTS